MKPFLVASALLLTMTAAQAQYIFEYGGRTIRVDPDRGYVSIPGVYESEPRRERRARTNPDNERPAKKDLRKGKTAPAEAATGSPEQPASTTNAPDIPAAAAANAPDARPATAPATETTTAVAVSRDVKPNVVPRGPSPLGLWLTEEKEGMIRIEACGDNLCGYAVDRNSKTNGDLVLFDMKATKDAKWNGKIVDPSNGSTYESWIALKSSDALRIQGCAFGAMFCGGQTWTRVN